MFCTLSTKAFLAICSIFLAANIHAQDIKVTLLGTGSPPPVMNRFGPSVLVEAGNQKLIFDTGRGVLQRLTEAGVKPKDITGVFFTHLHSDHLVGFPDLWLTGWVNGRREVPHRVFGPKGTAKMTSHLEQAFEYDIKIRLYDDRPPPEGILIEATDIAQGVAFEKDGVKVTAFDVDHEPIKPAFGYRVDFKGRSVVISGDTSFSENLIKHSAGVDVLIHEVVSLESLKRAKYSEERIKTIINHHISPERAGELFTRVRPRMAVYYHIVIPSATPEDLIPQTRKTYAGPLELGEDLMVIEIGEKIGVRRPDASRAR